MILIIDKPAGLPVHAGPKGGETLEQHLQGLRYGLPDVPQLAHRLDRDTSGCLILGRHKKALRRLGKLFETGKVRKTYWAIVQGCPPSEQGRIDAPLAKRSTAKRGWWMQVDRDAGKPALTDYRVMAAETSTALLELHPRTGRTHQLRVHLAYLGCPILGDPIYGSGGQEDVRTEASALIRGDGLMLHARAISLPLYADRPPIGAVAEPPAAMRSAMSRLNLGAGTCGALPRSAAPDAAV